MEIGLGRWSLYVPDRILLSSGNQNRSNYARFSINSAFDSLAFVFLASVVYCPLSAVRAFRSISHCHLKFRAQLIEKSEGLNEKRMNRMTEAESEAEGAPAGQAKAINMQNTRAKSKRNQTRPHTASSLICQREGAKIIGTRVAPFRDPGYQSASAEGRTKAIHKAGHGESCSLQSTGRSNMKY